MMFDNFAPKSNSLFTHAYLNNSLYYDQTYKCNTQCFHFTASGFYTLCISIMGKTLCIDF